MRKEKGKQKEEKNNGNERIEGRHANGYEKKGKKEKVRKGKGETGWKEKEDMGREVQVREGKG